MRSIVIDTAALRHNLQQVRHFAPGRKVLAMVKANAYGHGLLTVAEALHQADGFGVADIHEAICLRQAGFKQPILVMRGFCDATELAAFAHYDLMAVVHQWAQVELLSHNTLAQPIGVWLKVDSGMHRLGFLPEHVRSAFERLSACAYVRQPLCVMTHFADANDPTQITTARQWMCFEQSLAALPSGQVYQRSLANSAGIICYPEIVADWVRPGIMLYGASPFVEHAASNYGLQPVMTVSSRLIAIHQLPAGAAIGYGGSFVCPSSMTIGIVAFGYGDGYPRQAPTGTPIMVGGRLTRIVGRVSMDMISVDLSGFDDIAVGAEVILWGKGLPVEAVAERVGTIAYELFCHIQRHRLYPRRTARCDEDRDNSC